MTREKFLAQKRKKLEKAWKAWNAYRDRMAGLGLHPLAQHELVDEFQRLRLEEAGLAPEAVL
jgi:hypothetical protein